MAEHDGPHEYEDLLRPSWMCDTLYRPCTIPGCRAVTLDPLHDVDTMRDDDGFLAICSCGEYGDGPTEAEAEAALGCVMPDLPTGPQPEPPLVVLMLA